jgi:hypothetical protein
LKRTDTKISHEGLRDVVVSDVFWRAESTAVHGEDSTALLHDETDHREWKEEVVIF